MLYTTIIHDLRVRHGLTIPEYCVIEAIRIFSTNPKAPVPGWCNASKAAIGEALGVSKAFVVTTIDKLFKLSLIEKENDGRLLRISKIWFDELGQDMTSGKASDRRPVKHLIDTGKASDLNRSHTDPNRSDSIPPSNNKLYTNSDTKFDKEESPPHSDLKFTDEHFVKVFDERTIEETKMTFPLLDVSNELKIFKLKVRGARADYLHRDDGGIRQAFIYQLKNSTANGNRIGTKKDVRGSDTTIEGGKEFGSFQPR